MKKAVIGYISDDRTPSLEDKKFFSIAKEMNIELVPFNINFKIIEEEVEKKAKECRIIFNNSDYLTGVELVKTLEAMGKKVIDPSKVRNLFEDKWIFFVKCKENHILTPTTILLPIDLDGAEAELKEFNRWPVVLKRVDGERGKFVDKGENMADAIKIIKHFWENDNERSPILAQEFIDSNCYRVTVIDKKIVQTAIKKKHSWKATGCYASRFWHFKVDKNLKRVVDKIIKMTNIDVCGIDFLKKDSEWLALEVNKEPSLKMFDSDHERLIRLVLKCLKKKAC
jgi:glutathione synthase/RimK-type ligase-like ATP-grasp enzyme